MFTSKLITQFIVILQFIGLIYGMCNNEKNSWDNTLIKQKKLNDLDDIKRGIENLDARVEINQKDLPLFDIRFDNFPYKCQGQVTPSNCAEATACTKRSGYYYIKVSQFSNEPFLVECDAHHDGGDWTVIQRRQDGSVDFYRTWSEYKRGFGEIDGEFFIGMDKLHALTNYYGPQELLVLMVNDTNVASAQGYAKYDAFMIGNESEKYVLKRTGRYTGTAGESLRGHMGFKFSTKDQDNTPRQLNCATMYLGAWWYNSCHLSNLNGHFGDDTFGKGINWFTFSGHNHSLRFVKMMIRRRRG